MTNMVRVAEPGDEMGVARVHVNAWQVAYRGLLPDAYLDRLQPEERAAKYDFSHLDPMRPRTIVATNGREIHGFATTAPERGLDISACGEVCALYVDPTWWRRGVGRALVAAARSHLAGSGFTTAVLWVLVGNSRADRFYRDDGWTFENVLRTAPVWGVTIDEARYRRNLEPPARRGEP